MAAGTILLFICVIVALEWDWCKMAGAFLVRELGPERRELNVLRGRLAVLKWLAAQIGKTEAELRKREPGEGAS